MNKQEKEIILVLLRKLQKILINDDNIPLSSAKEINKIIIDIQNILKNMESK